MMLVFGLAIQVLGLGLEGGSWPWMLGMTLYLTQAASGKKFPAAMVRWCLLALAVAICIPAHGNGIIYVYHLSSVSNSHLILGKQLSYFLERGISKWCRPHPSLSGPEFSYGNLRKLPIYQKIKVIRADWIFRLDALALSVIATATWLAGWVAGWVAVTLRYCIKTAKPIGKLFRPSERPIILVFWDPCADTKFQGEPHQRGR